MVNKNMEKNKQIKIIVVEFAKKFSSLRKKRDDVVTNFLNALKKRKLEEFRKKLNQL